MPQADEQQQQQQQRPAVTPSSASANQTPSSSSTNVASIPLNSSQPLTVDSLLRAVPDRDPLIALESLLAERNSLTAQNVQLWKLIEKQRTMYNNATREIERLKASAERNGSTSGDGSAISTSSNTARRAESQQRGDDRTQRAKVARTNSDDQAVQKQHLAIAHSNHTRALSPSRSQDLRTNGASLTSVASDSKSAPLTTTPNPSQRPTRGESLPTSTPPIVYVPLPSSTNIPAVVPLNVQKKSSTTPLSTAPAPSPAVVVPIIETSSSSTFTSPVATEPPTALAPALGGNLAPQPRDRRAARESRISLPDEAARYIAAMGDSPSGSPGLGNDSAGGLAGYTEQAQQGAEFGISTGDFSIDADATIRSSKRSGNVDDGDHTPVQVEVSYPVPPERSPPPPPMVENGNGYGQGRGPAQVHSYGHGANGLGRNGSFDYNDAATPMPTQLTYASQRQQYPMYAAQQQQQPYQQQAPPVRTQLHTQTSGSGGRPSMQQHITGSAVSLPGSQLSSPSESTLVHSDYSRDLKETYQAAQSTPAQSFRDLGFYDVSSQSPAQHPRTNQYPSPGQPGPQLAVPPAPRLHPSQLASTRVRIVGSNIRSNERGKDVLSFLISVFPPSTPHAHNQGAEEWKVEKMYSDVLALDGSVRGALGRSHAKKLPPLPDAKLFKDNAPAKVDQRRAILEQYLQALLIAPLKDPSDICAFFSTDLSRGDRAPVTSQGYKEGYLTKRGKNFGGWKTRYFVLQTSVLEYYESRGGTHLGSINISGSQIGRQQKQASPDDENAYRHAFLIIEQGRKGTAPARHVLCAASDAERDEWVDVLVHSVAPASGSAYGDDSYPQSDSTVGEGVPSRPSTSSTAPSERGGYGPENGTGHSPVERGPGGLSDAQLAQRMLERNAGASAPVYQGNVTPSSSLPSSLDHNVHPAYQQARSNSSLGHYTESPKDPRGASQFQMQDAPNSNSKSRSDKGTARTSYHPALSNAKVSSSSHAPSSAPTAMTERDKDDSSAGESTTTGSVVGTGSKKISGPLNAQPIPAGYKFGGNKDGPGSGADASPVGGDRATKAKSGRFWPTFGKGNGNTSAGSNSSPYASSGAPSSTAYAVPGRAVFGVPLETSLAIAKIANLPAIVFRCIEYLEVKKAADEEGIYRLSGSSAVIKALKDRFNHEGDVNLLKHDEHWDPHAISGLLKQFLRDLPTSILTRELQQRFLSVVDLMDSNERVNELAHLVSQLPVANYSLLRAMITHLILIVQNSAVNKMTMRNVGIVFSPTLGIPAGILSLMLGEFDRVFNVDATDESSDAASSNEHDSYTAPPAERTPQQKRSSGERSTGRLGGSGNDRVNKRNSLMYNNTDTDRMLGLGGRKLEPPDESSDGEDVTMPEESDSDTDQDETSSGPQTTSEQTGSGSPPSPAPLISVSYPVTNGDSSGAQTHMRAVAATRGLQISVGGKGAHRASGLPTSPRPNRYPGSPGHGG